MCFLAQCDDVLLSGLCLSSCIISIRYVCPPIRFGLCPHLTPENRENLRGQDLLTAYFNVDYHRNIKGTNYWRNRLVVGYQSVITEWANSLNSLL